MGKIREMEKLAKSPGVKMAVVQVKYGESLKKAWNRHLTENPGDASVMIKIFNQPVLLQSAADTTSQGLIPDENYSHN
jgi:hypothetical protein